MTWRAIAINEEIYNKPFNIPEETKKITRLNVQLYLPPSDIPQYVYSRYEKEKDVFYIIFKYINEEKEEQLFNENNVRLLIGSQSGKPLKIELKDISIRGINQIQLTNIIKDDISRLIENKVRQIENIREKTNLQCAEEFLRQSANQFTLQPV